MREFNESMGEIVRQHKHCVNCGSPLIEKYEVRRFDRETGAAKPEVWRECPRFARSWRNLWLGGLGHDSFQITPPFGSRDWR